MTKVNKTPPRFRVRKGLISPKSKASPKSKSPESKALGASASNVSPEAQRKRHKKRSSQKVIEEAVDTVKAETEIQAQRPKKRTKNTKKKKTKKPKASSNQSGGSQMAISHASGSASGSQMAISQAMVKIPAGGSQMAISQASGSDGPDPSDPWSVGFTTIYERMAAKCKGKNVPSGRLLQDVVRKQYVHCKKVVNFYLKKGTDWDRKQRVTWASFQTCELYDKYPHLYNLHSIH